MEPTVVSNNGIVATFSDDTAFHKDRLQAEFRYQLSLQPSQFKNIFAVGKTKAQIRNVLADPKAIQSASEADGKPTGNNLPGKKISTTTRLNVLPPRETQE